MLRIAVQSKGRLYEDTMSLFKEVGISLSTAKRTLLISSTNFPVEVLFLRDDDIPSSVANGVADVGIVGENEYIEKGAKATLFKRLGFSRCRLSLAIPKELEYTDCSFFEGKTIATSYPVILSKFLESKGVHSRIHEIGGSVEIAPSIGLSDGIFDIVSSGSTLVSNHLKEVEVVMKSEALLIASPNLTKEKEEILRELDFRIEAVQKAEGKKYLLMNVPNESIDRVVKELPGMKSPTIMPLAEEGWSSVHTVIEERHFWEIINRLRQAGAEGILVIPIEKMIL